MKLVLTTFLTFFALMPFAASAQTPVTGKTANAYYSSCASQSDERLTPDGQTALCSCVAAKIMTVLTMEEIAEMSDKPGPGRKAYDKMLINAYGPCQQVPVQEQISKECMTDSRIEQFGLKDKAGLCECVGRRTADFVASEASPLTIQILRKAPDTTDLYQAFLDDGYIRQTAYENVNKCLQTNNQ